MQIRRRERNIEKEIRIQHDKYNNRVVYGTQRGK